jgi:site-specific DNA recombinase
MTAAIYARKSTDQSAVADDQKSVTRQVENARAYAARKGWMVLEEHVYVDDGISGAIFGDGRPGFLRMMNALKPGRRAPFDALIMSEESRLGREQQEVGYAFKQLVTAGVRIFLYLEDRERLLESATDKFMLSVATFADEMEREKARQRTRDAMVRKAKAGHVTGGRVFGYDNVRLDGHVERRINDQEAAVVCRIFELAALGHGLRVIAHSLNADGLAAPRPQLGRPKGWAPSTVRDVLSRPIYRGVIEWGRLRRNSERRQLKRHANRDPLRIDAPALRIVPEDLAAAVDASRLDRRERYLRKTDGRLLGGPAPRVVKHVLSGLMVCSCGATFEAQTGTHGRRRGGVYICSAARRKGRSVCTNDLHLPISETESRVLDTVERELLNLDVFDDAIAVAVERLSQQTPARAGLLVELERLERELGNLAAAVASGAAVATLVAEMRSRESRKREIERLVSRPTLDREGLRATLSEKLDDWKRLLRSRPTHGQCVLRTILDGPIVIGTPTAAGVPWEARGALFGMLGTLSQQVASPAGFEPALPT